MKSKIIIFVFLLYSIWANAQYTDAQLGLKKGLVYSQIGYLPTDKKEVLLLGDTLQVLNANYTLEDAFSQVVKMGAVSFIEKKWRRNVYLIDLSSVQTEGNYTLKVDTYSATIKISNSFIQDIGIPRIFQSFFKAQRTEKDIILPLRRRVSLATRDSFPVVNNSYRKMAGWKDACSNDQHIIHSSIITDLLNAYEINPALFDNDKVNGVPRILLEVKWGLTYLLSMQQPSGSFYCNVSADKSPWDVYAFDRSIVNDTSTYLNVRATTALAQSYNSLKQYFPLFADSCLTAAKIGWYWHLQHPSFTFNEQAYWDAKYDSRLYGAFELWKATGEQQYKDTLDAGILRGKLRYTADGARWQDPGWGWQSGLGSDWLGWFGMQELTSDNTIMQIYARYYPLASPAIKNKIQTHVGYLKSWLKSSTQKSYKFFEPLLYDGFGMCGNAMGTANKVMQLAKALNDSELMNIGLENFNFVYGKNPIGKSFVSKIGTDIDPNSWQVWADTIKGAVLPGIILTANLPTNNCALSGSIGALGWRCDEWSTINTSGMLVCFAIIDSRKTPATAVQTIKEDDSQFAIYPNPANAQLKIQLDDSKYEYFNANKNQYIKISNTFGQTILQQPFQSENRYYSINISFLRDGMYFITVGRTVKPFIVKH